MSYDITNSIWASTTQKGDSLLLLLALASYANEEGICWPSQATLASRARCSERGARNILHRLIESGDVEVLRKGGALPGEGHASTIYRLSRYMAGRNAVPPRGRNAVPGTEERHSPLGRNDIPGTGERHSGVGRNAVPANLSLEPTIEPTNKNQSQEVLTLEMEGGTPFRGPTAEQIYDAYPRKTAKPAALKAIASAMRRASPEVLLERTKAYATARAGADPAYTPHAATWFNQHRYNDDQKGWAPASKAPARIATVPIATKDAPKTFDLAAAAERLRLSRNQTN